MPAPHQRQQPISLAAYFIVKPRKSGEPANHAEEVSIQEFYTLSRQFALDNPLLHLPYEYQVAYQMGKFNIYLRLDRPMLKGIRRSIKNYV